ncbi:winged helix-turn-helix domain-containing protein [Halosimplex pelagicum]|uniref:Helix-turn-helix transcriptional regulator n=1 Tax=Halosimplex pelagicum TaxID=869886 RepID=A0A7D5TBY5_9EURY|nr:helix-turn-helix domain-containing protein [Halosimplex pelagicum]QLH81715.1 helix-turn-helix transcriptional regulator [Halosimplex pelagicum]
MSEGRDRAFLDAVGDEDCKTILDAVRTEAKTIPELSEECDIPLSTAYRKVNRLQEADLVAEKNRLPEDCRPKNVYELRFDGAVVTMGEEGFAVEFAGESSEPTAPGRIADLSRSAVGSD